MDPPLSQSLWRHRLCILLQLQRHQEDSSLEIVVCRFSYISFVLFEAVLLVGLLFDLCNRYPFKPALRPASIAAIVASTYASGDSRTPKPASGNSVLRRITVVRVLLNQDIARWAGSYIAN
jgi:hypothetical protein